MAMRDFQLLECEFQRDDPRLNDDSLVLLTSGYDSSEAGPSADVETASNHQQHSLAATQDQSTTHSETAIIYSPILHLDQQDEDEIIIPDDDMDPLEGIEIGDKYERRLELYAKEEDNEEEENNDSWDESRVKHFEREFDEHPDQVSSYLSITNTWQRNKAMKGMLNAAEREAVNRIARRHYNADKASMTRLWKRVQPLFVPSFQANPTMSDDEIKTIMSALLAKTRTCSARRKAAIDFMTRKARERMSTLLGP
jgi:hypothetical protein